MQVGNGQMVHIRKAVLEDREQVFSLAEDFAMSFRPRFDAFAEAFGHLYQKDDALILVAEESERVIGYLLGFDHWTFFANGRVSWVEEVAVHQDHRGRNIGRDLMDGFEQWASSRGSKLVALATRRAAAFYMALGYDESAVYFRKLIPMAT